MSIIQLGQQLKYKTRLFLKLTEGLLSSQSSSWTDRMHALERTGGPSAQFSEYLPSCDSFGASLLSYAQVLSANPIRPFSQSKTTLWPEKQNCVKVRTMPMHLAPKNDPPAHCQTRISTENLTLHCVGPKYSSTRLSEIHPTCVLLASRGELHVVGCRDGDQEIGWR